MSSDESQGERDFSGESDISLEESEESDTDYSDNSESDESCSTDNNMQQPSKNVSWSKIDAPDTEFNIKSSFKGPDSGIKNCPPKNSPPLLYLYFFLTPSLWIKMVNNTNMYANQLLQKLKSSGKKPESPMEKMLKNWKDVSISEMKLYIAMLMNMSITVQQNVKHYWNPITGMPWFENNMSCSRFKSITAMFHFEWQKQVNHEGEPGYDCFHKISPLLTELNALFKMYFTPTTNIAIDESRIGFKSNCPVVRYLPNWKRPFCGIKRFDLCDSEIGYILHSSLYLVKDHAELSSDEFNSKFMVQMLSETDLLDKGYNLCIENTSSNLALSENLIARETFLSATYAGGKSKKLPKLPKKRQIAPGETLHFKNNSSYFVAFKDPKTREIKKYISNIAYTHDEFKSGKVDAPNLRKNYIPKCGMQIAKKYGVTEETFGNISCTRTTVHYWRFIFYTLLDMCSLNAWILHSQNSDKKLKRSDFVIKLVEQLEKDSKGKFNSDDPETGHEDSTSDEESDDSEWPTESEDSDFLIESESEESSEDSDL